MSTPFYQIAIDGPAGAGKSTIAQLVAKQLNFLFINTGGMYRCYAIALKNTDLNNLPAVSQVLKSNQVTLEGQRLFLNGVDVTNEAYTSEISGLASTIGTIKIVRQKCVLDQQAIAQGHNVVMEGRDTTTVVLPNATLKVFLTASPEVRAHRRWLQSNKTQSLAMIDEDIRKRDYQDTHRAIDPLTKTTDAIEINTDNKTIDQNVNEVITAFMIKKEGKCA